MLRRTLDNAIAPQLLRFLMVGGINTLVGYSAILGLLWLGVTDVPANLTGYIIGLVISFALNRKWTFGKETSIGFEEIIAFLMGFAFAYGCNLYIIIAANSAGIIGHPLVHLIGVLIYTIIFFLFNRYFIYPANNDKALTQSQFWPEWFAVSLSFAALPLLMTLRLTHDVSWQFWIARQMAIGVPLYERIMEVNPPLWFWMALPLHRAGNILGIEPDRLYIMAISIAALIAAIVTGRLLYKNNNRRRSILMPSILALTLLAPLYDFGQREQLAAIAALPYCALIFGRSRQKSIAWHISIMIGFFAAIGFALKHYFILVPIALELWLLFQTRKILWVFRPETIALGISAIIYGFAIFYLTPAFITDIIPMVGAAYDGYEKPILFQIIRTEVLLWLFAALAYVNIRPNLNDDDKAIADILGLAGIAFAFSYFAQQKGWQYHAIPAAIFISLMMVHCLSCQKNWLSFSFKNPLALVAAILFLTIGITRGPYDSGWANAMHTRLKAEKAGDSVMILTIVPRRVFPFVEQYKLLWPSRHFAHWMIAAIAHAETGLNGKKMTPKLIKLGEDIRQQALEDMQCHPPKLLLIQIRNNNPILDPKYFRMKAFFMRNIGFKNYLMQNYTLSKTDRVFETYRRITPPVVTGHNCFPVSVKT